MPAPHIAFASSSAVSNSFMDNPPLTSSTTNSYSHSTAATTTTTTATGPLPLFPPASAPITVSNAILDGTNSSSNSNPNQFNSYSYNKRTSSRFAPVTGVSTRTLAPTTGTSQAHIISAFAPASDSFAEADEEDDDEQADTAHPLSFRQRFAPAPAAATTSFSAASLPRTSSLLPPARVIAKTVPVTNGNGYANSTVNGGRATANPPVSSTAALAAAANATFSSASTSTPYGGLDAPATIVPAYVHKHRPSRSNSVGGTAPDPARFAATNRWSASTAASSRASIAGSHQLYHRHQRSASFSRRLSVDSLGSPLRFSEFEPTTVSPTASPDRSQKTTLPQVQTTPRKLQKARPGTSSNNSSPLRERGSPLRLRESPSTSRTAPRQLSPVRALSPFTSLPPIIALPSLEQEVQGGTASFADFSGTLLGEPISFSTTEISDISEIPNLPLPTMYSRDHPEAVSSSRGYTRSRSQAANGSTDSTKSNSNANGSSTGRNGDSHVKDRSSKPPSQKAMLSRALQKANTAVQLDNAGNIEGAREAYAEACGLLQQVLVKTPGEEDKRKLEAIKVTYTARIEELDLIASTQRQDTRPLPRRPSGSSGRGRSSSDAYSEDDAEAGSDTGVEPVEDLAQMSRIYDDDAVEPHRAAEPRSVPGYSIPQSSSSPRLIQSGFGNATSDQPHVSSLLRDQYTLQSTFSRSPRKEFIPPHQANANNNANNAMGPASSLQPPAGANQYMPPPLSPRRVAPPSRPFEDAPTAYRYNPNEDTLPSARYGSTLRPGSANANNNDNVHNHAAHGHQRTPSHESVSWLDPINESGSSAASSVHSRSSSLGIRRKHIRAASGATEAEFDAALDDAIEAAYDDGYEPMNSDPIYGGSQNYKGYGNGDAQVSNSLRKVELAKERVRETEREAIAFERQLRLREQLMMQQEEEEDMPRDFLDDDNDSEDEERILEEMTTGLAIEDFTFGLKKGNNYGSNNKQPPRESDSSEFTSRTWHSSMASNPPTATTVLSTVSESNTLKSNNNMPPPPPPTQALPSLPPQMPSPSMSMPPPPVRPSTAQTSPVRGGSAQSVRNRRLSGQNMKQLKIETTKLNPPGASNNTVNGPQTAGNASTSMSSTSLSASAALPQQPRTAGFLVSQRQALSAGPNGPPPALPAGAPGSISRPGSSAAGAGGRPAPTPSPGAGATMFFGASPVESVPPPNFPPPTPPIPQGFSDNDGGRAGSPNMGRPGLRKNFSSSSLRSMRSRNMSVTNLEGGDMSPGTPLSNQFASTVRMPDLPTLPTPSATTFKDRMIIAASGVGGMHLLESDFHSPSTPGSPNPMYSDAPVPLEPCPTDTMLRPFWLMRCLYQTLVHPRGGYLSNKLFVPSDVWKVKGVRLKNIDEKVANCDFLTSALLKLAQVDTCDADAVLEEMQSLENVLEQTQNTLSRRLGNDVGPQSANALFKEASTGVGDNEGGGGGGNGGPVPRTSSVSGQSSRSFSWRRLRSKNSSAGLSSSYNQSGRKESVSDAPGSSGGPGTGSKDGGPLSSLPMTAQPTRRPAKRDVSSAKFAGPNAVYMNSLARLFDAAQSIDQIARQVEDPGLRHADKTQVGLELCTRHAAEFFAFYICRFVLSDVSLLLEKFIKRGSEWVLA